jgi:hypothetical protein
MQGNDGGLNNQNSPFVNAAPSASSNNVLLRDSPNAMDLDLMVSVPYAFVDVIADGSPAAEDGLQLGDQIVKFGNVEAGENLSQRLLSEAQTNQGCAIPVVVMRQGALINFTVTPRTWQGRGLLGYVCHLLYLCSTLYKFLVQSYLQLPSVKECWLSFLKMLTYPGSNYKNENFSSGMILVAYLGFIRMELQYVGKMVISYHVEETSRRW